MSGTTSHVQDHFMRSRTRHRPLSAKNAVIQSGASGWTMMMTDAGDGPLGLPPALSSRNSRYEGIRATSNVRTRERRAMEMVQRHHTASFLSHLLRADSDALMDEKRVGRSCHRPL